jgi:SHS2 domain-containing protein
MRIAVRVFRAPLRLVAGSGRPRMPDRPGSGTLQVMMHRFVEHMGEVELEIVAVSEAAVFREALAAFGGLVGEGEDGEPARHDVEVSAGDRALLLVEWLSELVFLAEVDGFVPERLSALDLSGGHLRATVEGRRGRPRHLVKAVTLNNLELERAGDHWYARLVLDV